MHSLLSHMNSLFIDQSILHQVNCAGIRCQP